MKGIGFKFGINGRGRNRGIPYKSDLLFTLSGAILDDGGTYYFIDKSGNSRNFLITDYDFSTDWTKGFPYKSAATISAPVGDATLIAADINNYLYDSGGTPNQIPVVSLFQDIDYEHKLFCKHQPQILDAISGIELVEPYVKDITLYATVKSGADLVKCNSYFDVPTYNLDATWIDPVNGNDSTGTGTELLPYKTLESVTTKTLTTSYVLVKTGSEQFISYWIQNKAYKYISIGRTILSSASTTFVISNSGINAELRNFIIDASSTVIGMRTSVSGLIVDRCKATGSTGRMIEVTGGSSLTVQNSIFNNASYDLYIAFSGVTINASGNFTDSKTFLATISGNNSIANILYNKGIGGIFLVDVRNSNTFNVKYNIVYGKLNVYSSSDCSGSFTAEYNDVYATANGAMMGQTLFSDILFNYSWYISHNKFYYGAYYGTAIELFNQTVAEIEYNYFDGLSTTTSIEAAIIDSRVRQMTSIKFNYNSVCFSGNLGTDLYTVQIGNQVIGNFDNYCSGAEIIGNKILGPIYYGNAAGVSHAIFLTHASDAIIKYNYVNGTQLGIVVKGWHSNSNTIILYNVTSDCINGILIKGYEYSKVYGNTIFNNKPASTLGLALSKNPDEADHQSNNTEIRNNIIVDKAASSSFACISIDVATTGETSNYNDIYTLNNDIGADTVSVYTFAQWQVLGFDANSINQDPLLLDFIPQTGSPAIGNGETLADDYRTGLDATTDWGSDTEVPTVVTKLQGEAWDIGAYIH